MLERKPETSIDARGTVSGINAVDFRISDLTSTATHCHPEIS
jgi:hypothetical protein